MKFIVNGALLAKALAPMSSVPQESKTLPLITNFLFEIGDNDLTVTATDLENAISVKLPLENVEKDKLSKVAVPAKLFLDFAKTFGDAPLIFLIDENTYTIEIRFGEGKYNIMGYDGEDFPVMSVLEGAGGITIPANVLVSGIEKTVPAVGSYSDQRPPMSGIFFDIKPEYFTMVGTNAHMLSRYRRYDLKSEQEASFIFPKKGLALLKNIMTQEKDDNEVTINYNITNAQVQIGKYVLGCRLCEGRYPNYEAAIPQDNPNRLEVSYSDFMHALKRVAIFANQALGEVRLQIKNTEMFLVSNDVEMSYSGKERVVCSYEGEPIEIGFNANYLISMVSTLETDRIVMEFSTPSRPGIMLPLHEKEEDTPSEDSLLLIMPITLN